MTRPRIFIKAVDVFIAICFLVSPLSADAIVLTKNYNESMSMLSASSKIPALSRYTGLSRAGELFRQIDEIEGLGIETLSDLFKPEIQKSLNDRRILAYASPSGNARYLFSGDGLYVRITDAGHEMAIDLSDDSLALALGLTFVAVDKVDGQRLEFGKTNASDFVSKMLHAVDSKMSYDDRNKEIERLSRLKTDKTSPDERVIAEIVTDEDIEILKEILKSRVKDLLSDTGKSRTDEIVNGIIAAFLSQNNVGSIKELAAKDFVAVLQGANILSADLSDIFRQGDLKDGVTHEGVAVSVGKLLAGSYAGKIGLIIGMTRDEIIDFYAKLLGLIESEAAYFRNFYYVFSDLYDPVTTIVKTLQKIEETFYPNILFGKAVAEGSLTKADVERFPNIDQYGKFTPVEEGETLLVSVIHNVMDGGTGTNTIRQENNRELVKRAREIDTENKEKGVETSFEAKIKRVVNAARQGCKSAESFFETTLMGTNAQGKKVEVRVLISIMEAKLIKAILDAGKYENRSTYQFLGSSETDESIARILDDAYVFDVIDATRERKRTYGGILGEQGGKIQKQTTTRVKAFANVDRRYGTLTSMRASHGSHGQQIFAIMQKIISKEREARKKEKPVDRVPVIRAIYNGDGVNNGVSPTMIKHMLDGQYLMAMVTTDRTLLDVKGGIIGLRKNPKTGELYFSIMELAEAKAAGQEEKFTEVGVGLYGKTGGQLFNTNTVIINETLLGELLVDILYALTETEECEGDVEKAKKILFDWMSPLFLPNPKKEGSAEFYVLEGAMGSSILNLASNILNCEYPAVRKLAETRAKTILAFFNGETLSERTDLFTPYKMTYDFWYLFLSGRYSWDPDAWRLVDNTEGKYALPAFDFTYEDVDGSSKELPFYMDVKKMSEAFDGLVTYEGDKCLKELSIRGSSKKTEILLPNVSVFGTVRIFDKSGRNIDINSLRKDILRKIQGKPNAKVVGKGEDQRLVLEDIKIVIDEHGEIESAEGISSVQPSLTGKVSTGKYAQLWEAPLTDGKLLYGKDKDGAKDHAKYGSMDKEFIRQRITDAIAKVIEYNKGQGIVSVVDAIRLVDNIDAAEELSLVPYTALSKEPDGRIVLLIDIDALSNLELLAIEMDHEFKHSIMNIMPNIPAHINELTAIFMSLQLALEQYEQGKLNQEEFLDTLKRTGMNEQFLAAISVLIEKDVKSKDQEKITAIAIEYMRGMSYYIDLFQQFDEQFRGDWEREMPDKIKDASKRFKAALDVFNGIAEAKALAGKVAETKGKVDTAVKGLNDTIKKIKMITGQWAHKTEFLDTLVKQNKFVKLDVDQLAKTENQYLIDWLKGLRQDHLGVFLFFSATGSVSVGEFLSKNNISGKDYTTAISAEKIDVAKDVITLLELSGLDTDKDMGTGLFLPYVYSVSGIYLAAQVVIAGGQIQNITDNLVKTTLKKTYEALFGEELTDDDLNKLFSGKWPKAYKITESINALRKAIAQIEVAA
jgi:hypothetical protein